MVNFGVYHSSFFILNAGLFAIKYFRINDHEEKLYFLESGKLTKGKSSALHPALPRQPVKQIQTL